MNISVKNNSENICNEAEAISRALNRSIADPIEYSAKFEKLFEENPEYNSEFIRDVILAQEEAKSGKLEKFVV